jgi:hypothetical protein
MKYKNVIKLRLPEIQLLAVVPTQLEFSVAKDHDQPTVFSFETLFCMWECFSMGTELPTKVMLGQTLVLMQMSFLNNVRKVGRLVLSRTSSYLNNLNLVICYVYGTSTVNDHTGSSRQYVSCIRYASVYKEDSVLSSVVHIEL